MPDPVLIIAPHALDEALGCGGAIARHADEGDQIHVLVLFGDGTGRDSARRIAAARAANVLGSLAPRFCGFAENRSDSIPLVEIVAAIERMAGEVNPKRVYVSHGGNLNVDHQNAFRATVTALRPVPGSSVRAIYAYEILSSTDWAPKGMGEPFRAVRFVDISRQFERKLEALAAYGGEMRPAPHSRSLENVRALAVLRGATAGFPMGEAFEVVRVLD